ncbi:hypothetical protein D3C81_839590 [compost metagenome]
MDDHTVVAEAFSNSLQALSIGTKRDITQALCGAGHQSHLILGAPFAAQHQMLTCHAGFEPDSFVEGATHFQIRNSHAYVL